MYSQTQQRLSLLCTHKALGRPFQPPCSLMRHLMLRQATATHTHTQIQIGTQQQHIRQGVTACFEIYDPRGVCDCPGKQAEVISLLFEASGLEWDQLGVLMFKLDSILTRQRAAGGWRNGILSEKTGQWYHLQCTRRTVCCTASSIIRHSCFQCWIQQIKS